MIDMGCARTYICRYHSGVAQKQCRHYRINIWGDGCMWCNWETFECGSEPAHKDADLRCRGDEDEEEEE